MAAALDWIPDTSGVGARAIIRDPLSHFLIATSWVNSQPSTSRWGYAVERACDGDVRFGYRANEALARDGAELVTTAWLVGPVIAAGKPGVR